MLNTKRLGRQLIVVDDCASTFDIAEQFALSGAPHGLTVIATRQSQGRGRFGRNWLSPPGGLWMTVVLSNPELSSFVGGISLLGALSVVLTINKMFKVCSLVKWPNDVVIRSDKVGGILVESKFEGNKHIYSLLGIGLNVNFQPSVIRNVDQRVTTLLYELNQMVDINALASVTLKEIEDMFDLAAKNRISDLMEVLRANDYSTGRRVKVAMPDRTIEGTFHEYRSLAQTEIEADGEYVIVDTGTAIAVEYL